ncbi:MAG: MerR family transcriptional regulator [Actinobacteria bacterium]|nr:MerR family transcriptional regulator [Actinomycetota bacterium]MBU1944222.1 MerR family transcriptional regulator [Actinomycetota bacterium]MBU2688385.1 MerR family transcriptional regulator [Actinomycetota bacterium]
MADKPMRISDLEKVTGVGRSAIHHYIRMGLLTPPRKTGATMAYYDKRHVRELQQVRKLLDEGYPLGYIREMTAAGRSKARGAATLAGENRRREIMDTAIDLFARRGFHQTRVTDITGSIGIGQSTFYLYFADKESLFLECLDDLVVKMFATIDEKLAGETDPLLRIRKRAQVTLEEYPQFVEIVLALRPLVDENPGMEKRFREIFEDIAMPLISDLDQAVAGGRLSSIDTRLAAFALMGIMETASMMVMLNPETDVGELLDSLTALLAGWSGAGTSTVSKT